MTGKASPSFTSWKLDVLQAASADAGMSAGAFRFFYRVMAAVNEQTRVAILGDETAGEEVPGCKSRHTLNDHRKTIAALGYWTVEVGHGNRGTRYVISDAPVNAILDALTEARDRRHTRRDERRALRSLERKVVVSPRKQVGKGGETAPANVVVPPPVHLQDTPSDSPPTVQDMAPVITPPAERVGCQRCEECGQPATLNVGGEWRCDRHRPRAATEPDPYWLASRGE